MMVESYPNLKEEVGGSIPRLWNLLSTWRKTCLRWSIASCALTLACWPSVSKYKWKK
jgi:hypothetical protein